ncbi:MAG TPA: polysialyltransferase family glycosyltransferase [Zeimonas sp.]
MSAAATVAVYFVASPLQYLAARRIARSFDVGARHVLLWYKPALASVIDPGEWDACAYLPWPRWDPMPGPFGRHRRLRANVREVAALVGPCGQLLLHSAVFDTEAINYFLNALPAACGARSMHARILPDGILSVRRYPLSPLRRSLQWMRKLRRLAAPELDYRRFTGDRTGSDASFCDRVYVVAGLPHEYEASKVRELPALVEVPARPGGNGGERRALVVGQPLTGFRLMSHEDLAVVTASIRAWLADEGFAQIDYKAHPKDATNELNHPDYRKIDPPVALEVHLARSAYDAVVGVRSSALLFARQIDPEHVRAVAFGWDRVRFESDDERGAMRAAFEACGVEFR